jgi:hypothetical protein
MSPSYPERQAHELTPDVVGVQTELLPQPPLLVRHELRKSVMEVVTVEVVAVVIHVVGVVVAVVAVVAVVVSANSQNDP